MTPISPRKGFYQILNTYTEQHGKNHFIIADAVFKGENSAHFDKSIIKVRLSALYNESSEGPKECLPEKLTSSIVHIQDLVISTSSTATKYIVIWRLIESENYTELLNEISGIEGDMFSLQQDHEDLYNSLLADEMAKDEYYENVLNNQKSDKQRAMENRIIQMEIDAQCFKFR